MIYEKKPQEFNPKAEAVGCMVEYNGKILMLLCQDYKSYKSLWGSPAGKIKPEENISKAMSQELEEETGLNLEEKDIKLIKKFYLRYPHADIIYNLFHVKLIKEPKIIIDNKEHKDFKWLTPEQSLKLKLIPGEDFCIKIHL